VRRLSRELSQHLRYTMNSQTTVELGKEIEHVRNYLSLTEIRYPGTLTCTIDVDPALDKALVPPLLLQSFVENTVKHEVVMGEPMQIYLTIQEYWAGSSRKIHINIWDTGRGYQPELLERINAEADSRSDEIALGDGTHIGISNTIQRLRILFGDAVQIHFSNHTDAGAQCDINIPFTMTQQPTVSEEG
jgi:two-component system sensor histidine kinase YesM